MAANELYACAFRGEDHIVSKMLEQKVHVDSLSEISNRTALHAAASNGLLSTGALLLQAGASIDKLDDMGMTPLMVALMWGHEEFGLFLIDHGANCQARAHNGYTPLHCACYGGCGNILTKLIAGGAIINASDDNGDSPLHEAALYGRVEMAQTLIANGADWRLRNDARRTPLDVAIHLAGSSNYDSHRRKLCADVAAYIRSENRRYQEAKAMLTELHRSHLSPVLVP